MPSEIFVIELLKQKVQNSF